MVTLKLLTIGDSGVGKTCLLLKYSSGKFSPMFITTIGIDYKLKTINVDNHGEVKLQIWDTAGQERFRTLTASYFQGAHGILMVYDVSDRKSFESVSTWMNMIEQQADSDISLILVGNKCDLFPTEVSKEEGQKLAEEFEIPFHAVSAKTNEGVDECFLSLAQLVLSKPPKTRAPSQPLSNRQSLRRRRRGCC